MSTATIKFRPLSPSETIMRELAHRRRPVASLSDLQVLALVAESGVDPVAAVDRYIAWKRAEFRARGYR